MLKKLGINKPPFRPVPKRGGQQRSPATEQVQVLVLPVQFLDHSAIAEVWSESIVVRDGADTKQPVVLDIRQYVYGIAPGARAGEHDVILQPWSSTLTQTPDGDDSPDGSHIVLGVRDEDLKTLDDALAGQGVVQTNLQFDLNVTKFLASGGFSDVYLAQRGDVGGFAAVKVGKQYITLKDEKSSYRAWRRFTREVAGLRRAQGHPGLPFFVGAYMVRARFQEDCGINLALVTEYLPIAVSDLRRQGPMPELQARRLIAGVLEALAHIHARGVAHQDVKIANIMLKTKSGPVCLVDFGLAENWDAPRKGRDPTTVVGTPGYVAPEQFDLFAGAYDRRLADVYSTAIVLFNLVAQRSAFSGRTQEEILERNRNGTISFGQVEKVLSKSGVICLRTMSQTHNRPPAEHCLTLDWFTKSPEHLGADRKKAAEVQPGERTMKRSSSLPRAGLPVLGSLTTSESVRSLDGEPRGSEARFVAMLDDGEEDTNIPASENSSSLQPRSVSDSTGVTGQLSIPARTEKRRVSWSVFRSNPAPDVEPELIPPEDDLSPMEGVSPNSDLADDLVRQRSKDSNVSGKGKSPDKRKGWGFLPKGSKSSKGSATSDITDPNLKTLAVFPSRVWGNAEGTSPRVSDPPENKTRWKFNPFRRGDARAGLVVETGGDVLSPRGPAPQEFTAWRRENPSAGQAAQAQGDAYPHTQYTVGERVEYWSGTQQKYIRTTITAVDIRRHIQVDVKPNWWISLEAQREKIRSLNSAKVQMFAVGDRCEYKSGTHNKWVAASVLAVDKAGAIQLDVKPGFWIDMHLINDKVRRTTSQREVDESKRRAALEHNRRQGVE